MRTFYITEVFAEGEYSGNQLATVTDVAGLDPERMQQIARAFNFAETTFLMGGDLERGFDVRIFTPAAELPFAGHPTLGTSFLIRNVLMETPVDELILNLGVGTVTVRFESDGVLWMNQHEPVFGEVLEPGFVAGELGLDITQIDTRFPCQWVSTGLEFLLVPLNSYAALKQARSPIGALAGGCLAFCRGGYSVDQQVQARMFAGGLGVSEDPATGSANGCLAAWLAEHEYLGTGTVDLRVGQGYEIGRPSQLYLRSRKSPGSYDVQVGGRVNLVARGSWLI